MKKILLGLLIITSLATAYADSFMAIDSSNHPYVAKIYIGYGECTGSIVSPRIVLTAAHCVRKLKSSGQIGINHQGRSYAADLGFYKFSTFKSPVGSAQLIKKDLAIVYLRSPIHIQTYGELASREEIEFFLQGDYSLKVIGYAGATAPYLGESHLIAKIKKKKNYFRFKAPSKNLFGASGGPTIIAYGPLAGKIIGVNSLYNPVTETYRASHRFDFFSAVQELVELDNNGVAQDQLELAIKSFSIDYKFEAKN